MIALALYREGLCPLCGQPLDVCTSPEDGGPQFTPTYRACRASMEIADKQMALAEKNQKSGDRYARARLWGTTIRKG